MNNTTNLPDIKAKITWVNSDPTLNKKAAAMVTIANSFTIHGLAVVQGPNGLFVSMPQRSYEKNGEKHFQEVAHPVTAEMRKAVNDAVISAYKQEVGPSQSDEPSQETPEEELAEEADGPIMGQMA